MVDTDFEKYLKWVKDHGGSFQNLEFANGSAYATSVIKTDDSFATVPFKLCITEYVARQALPNLGDFSTRYVLTVFLVLQKLLGEKSFYWPYINILPKTIKTALFFDDNELQYIRNTNLQAATKERKSAIYENYTKLLDHLPADIERDSVKWEDFLWSYCVYSSRSFPYKLIDPSFTNDSEALFPLVDALNHKPRTKITWSRNGDVENGSLSFVAGQEFKEGEEVFNNYGPKSNEELLLGYGFCFEYNEYDHVALKPNFSQDPNFALKQRILQQTNTTSGNDDPLTFYIHRNNIPDSYFKLMRVLVMNPVELEHYAECTDAKFIEFIGYRNELCMLSMTLMVLKSKLIAIQSVDLQEGDLSDSQKFALMYRKGQEDILNTTITKIEDLKRNLIQRMYQDQKEGRVAPRAPFLSIVNSDFQQSDIEIDNSYSELVTLDKVVITLKRLLSKHPKFAKIISENFEDLEEEAETIMMLALIKENSSPKSEWQQFFHKLSQSEIVVEEDQVDELKEMYESIVPALCQAYPDVFDQDAFTFESFLWADNILNSYSINDPSLAIVPL